MEPLQGLSFDTRTILSKVWLDGNPVFSLTYEIETKQPRYNDLTGFRPDPSDYLKTGTKYPSEIVLHLEKNYKGVDQWVLRKIIIELYGRRKEFVYIR